MAKARQINPKKQKIPKVSKKAKKAKKLKTLSVSSCSQTPPNQVSNKKSKKFYAVGVGWKRGIFATHKECLKQTKGVSFSHHRLFSTLEDAEEYLDRYANVAIGTPNVNVSNSKFNQKMANNSAAEAKPVESRTTPSTKRTAAEECSAHNQQSKKPKLSKRDPSEKAEGLTKEELLKLNEEVERLRKKQCELKKEILKITQSVQDKVDSLKLMKEVITNMERLEAEVERELNSSIEAAKLQKPSRFQKETPSTLAKVMSQHYEGRDTEQSGSFEYDDKNFCKVYIRGVLLNSDPANKSGLGVFFGDGNKLNMSELLPLKAQTCANAQAMAAILACKVAKLSNIARININTTSSLLFKGVTQLQKKWEKNGWLNLSHQPVVLKEGLMCLNEAKKGLTVKWTHIIDRTDYGSNMALKLALQATMQE
ncbi:Hypothetical predicted protein [Cloeon dipterum]|uniref:ribonuclease H n=1 Tax=Cloeon dipterum TaxID=197152 RepID=A0A8S1CRS1_9INSE|nr:Hypothetical predicted protein [Cloeon dipterum]